jgi:hypothetical protein
LVKVDAPGCRGLGVGGHSGCLGCVLRDGVAWSCQSPNRWCSNADKTVSKKGFALRSSSGDLFYLSGGPSLWSHLVETLV